MNKTQEAVKPKAWEQAAKHRETVQDQVLAVTGARPVEREKWIDSDIYPNRSKCLECGTLVVKSKISRHDCWTSRLSQQYPKSPTLKLR